jgi:hypothetical protein
LSVRVPTPDQFAAFDQQLAARHYLGAGRPVGDYLRQVVEREEQAVALLVWGPACYAPKGTAPNLASQALAAAVRVLPGQWRQHFGYRPLLAESFTDPEAYAGTCYKASNWEPVGLSAGYQRHRADFHIPNQRPKKLWLYPLGPDAKQLLRAPQLLADCRAGLTSPPSGTLPVQSGQMDSLLDVFRRAPDPRDHNIAHADAF